MKTSSEYFFLFANSSRERVQLLVDFFRFLTSRARAEAFVRQVDSPVAIKGVAVETYSPRMRSTAELIGRATASYSAPPNMLQPPILMEVLTDARQLLFAGKMTPIEFGAKLEAAAASERARAAHPGSVVWRHPLAGFGLLALVLGGLVLAVWRRISEKRSAGNRDQRPSLRGGAALGFVAPSFLLYALLILAPGLVSLGWAFTTWDGLGERTWAGLFNFKWLLFESDVFWFALKNNLFLVLMPAAVVVPMSLVLAYLIHRGIKGGNTLRAVLLFPNLLGGIAATLLWMSAYEPHGGLVNKGLVALGNLLDIAYLKGFADHPWLASVNLYWSMIPIYIWMACGFNLVLYLAAMEGIDGDLYEAADIDGASKVRQFFSITLPMIKGVVIISLIFLVIGGLNAFEMVWLLTSQDPSSSTHTMGTLLVTTMFKEFQIGRATALAVVMLMLVLGASAVLLRRGKEEENE